MTRSLFTRAVLAFAVLAVLTTAACGGGSSGTSGSAAASPASGDLHAVTVTGAAGSKPTLKIPTPFSVKQTSWLVLTPGAGPKVTAGQKVTVDYSGFNGADGKEFDSSLGASKKSPAFVLDQAQTLPGLVKGLIGRNVGSRLLLAIPPSDGYGTQGAPSAGIGPTDTIVILVEIKSVKNLLTRATGTAVAPQQGLPTVALAGNGKPTITVPGGNPPARLVVQPLIVGTGPKVAKGEQITVHYTGVIWPGGKQFDSSWDRGKPATFGIGVGQVIAGWDEGLVGQPIGSQVLLVIPPDKGYGAAGKPDGGIKGTDTLVFVVDVLDAS
ncbi:MAG TPA: FKBP-type peptidyl-prolyl cis-trans isomerase [Kineosporiaceae bacterium]